MLVFGVRKLAFKVISIIVYLATLLKVIQPTKAYVKAMQKQQEHLATIYASARLKSEFGSVCSQHMPWQDSLNHNSNRIMITA